MSSAWPPPAPLSRPPRPARAMPDLDAHRLSSWPYPASRPDLFSSPPRSSSPPRTPPYYTKQAYDHAHIHSGSSLSPRADFRTAADDFEEPRAPWYSKPTPSTYIKSRLQTPASLMHQSTYTRYSVLSDFDASDCSEGLEPNFDDIRSDIPARTQRRPPSPFLDSRDDGADEGPGFSFSELGIRSMCFRTSAERGRWRTDPLPFQRSSVPLIRKSAPAADSATDILITSRPISEPAPAIPTSAQPAKPSEQDDIVHGVPSVDPSSVALSSFTTSPVLDLVDTLPPLTSDRDSSMDADEVLTPSSPLPPSSPPPLSPAVSAVHLPTVSISPTHSSPSSPIIAPSSPLSPISSEIGEEDAQELIPTKETTTAQEAESNLSPVEANAMSVSACCLFQFVLVYVFSRCQNPASTPRLQGHALSSCTPSHLIKLDPPESRSQAVDSCPEHIPSPPPDIAEGLPETPVSPATEVIPDQGQSATCPGDCPPPTLPKTANPVFHGPIDDEVLHPSDPNCNTELSVTSKSKRPSEILGPVSDDGPERKRMKFSDDDKISCSSNSEEPHEEMKSSAGVKKPSNPSRSEKANSTAARRRKRKSKYVVEESESESSSESSSSRPASPVPPRLICSDGIWRDRNGIAEADAEICGMIIEGMATSRASSLPISQICKIILQSRPSMRAEREEEEWCDVFCRILQSGVSGQGSGVFGKVDSSYKVSPSHATCFPIVDEWCFGRMIVNPRRRLDGFMFLKWTAIKNEQRLYGV